MQQDIDNEPEQKQMEEVEPNEEDKQDLKEKDMKGQSAEPDIQSFMYFQITNQ